MILILTYHRIIADEEPVPGPYTIRRSELDLQLQTVLSAWRNAHISSPLLPGYQKIHPPALGVLITFDDGTLGHLLHAAPILEKHEMRGVFYVSTALLGKEGYLDEAGCRELIARGHFVESHGHDHTHLTSLGREERLRQLRQSRGSLANFGGGRLASLAAVGGEIDEDTIEDARRAGFLSLRTLRWGYNRRPGAFLWESFNVLRTHNPSRFRFLIEPRFLAAKALAFRVKECLKKSRLRALYHLAVKKGSRP